MIIKTAACFAFAAVCLTAVATISAADASSGNASQGAARRNVMQSQHYDRLLATNGAFRKSRMRKECGPISDPQLRADCLASFSQDEPFVGSSSPRRHYRSEYGR